MPNASDRVPIGAEACAIHWAHNFGAASGVLFRKALSAKILYDLDTTGMPRTYWLGLSVDEAEYVEFYDYTVIKTSERLSGTRSGTASGWLSFSFKSLLALSRYIRSQEADDFNHIKNFAKELLGDDIWIQAVGGLQLDENMSDVPRGADYSDHIVTKVIIDLADNVDEFWIWDGEQADYNDRARVIFGASKDYGYYSVEKSGEQVAEDIEEVAMWQLAQCTLEEHIAKHDCIE